MIKTIPWKCWKDETLEPGFKKTKHAVFWAGECAKTLADIEHKLKVDLGVINIWDFYHNQRGGGSCQ